MAAPNWQPDLIGPLIGGMDAGLDPELIGTQQFAYGRNISVRGGRAHSRPRIVKRLSLPAGKIQGASAFKDRSLLMIGMNGRVYEADPGSWILVEKTSDTDCNNPNRPRMYFCETVGSIAIQDGQSKAILYDGSEFRRADDSKSELPTGWAMSYSNGRLALVTANGKSVRIGDIKGDDHQSEFLFTETFFLVGGGDFVFPQDVNALFSLPIIDTSTGQGSTVVGCRERIHSLKTQVTSRDIWADVGFETEVFPSSGIEGHRAAATVNQDLYFRSGDGLRSFRNAVGDYNTPGLVPISREVGYRLAHDSGHLLEDAVVVKFDNRLLVTHSPVNYGNRSIAQGLIVYNFDPISTGGQKSNPVYDGEWDFGIQIAEIVSSKFRGADRCFIIGRDGSGNGIWELLSEADSITGVSENPVQEIVTRTLGSTATNQLRQTVTDFSFKQLYRCDIWLSEMIGDVSLKVFFKSDKYPHWVQWDQFDIPGTANAGWGQNRPISRSPISTRTAPEFFDPRTGTFVHQGFGFQVRLVWTGKAKINAIQIWTKPIPQPSVADNTEDQDPTLYNEAPPGQEDRWFWRQFTTGPAP